MCPQVLSTADHWGPEFYYDFLEEDDDPEMSEDCLYLNVTTASTDATVATDKRPVYVWFHGGASMHGYSYEPEFSPEELAKKGVVVVSVAYRLGVFGYFVSDELAAEQGGTSGNYGFLDQIAALEWVQENIAAFGGDPENVTIGGQSAGASAVTNHLASEDSRGAGLFKRAIIESSLNAFSEGSSYKSKITSAGIYLDSKGFGDYDLADLRALTTGAFFEYGADREEGAPNKIGYYSQGFGICVGGHGLDKSPRAAFLTKGLFDGIDILFGSNDGESNANYNDGLTPLANFYPTNKTRYGDLYDKYSFEAMFPTNNSEIEARKQDLQRSSESTLMTAKLFAEISYNKKLHNNKMYEYYFSFWTPGRGQEYKWAWHSSELWYVFNSMRYIPEQRDWTNEDRYIGETLSSYWANFITSGNPNGESLPNWPEVNASNKFIKIGAERDTIIAAKTYLNENSNFIRRDMLLKEYAINSNDLQSYFLSTVTFNANGGTFSNGTTYQAFTAVTFGAVVAPPSPAPQASDSTYIFDKWTVAANSTSSAFDFATPITGDQTLYAQYVKKSGTGSTGSGGSGGGPGTLTPPPPTDTTGTGGTDSTGPSGPLSSFSDAVTVADWAIQFFEKLIGAGVIAGYTDGTLKPKGNVTRAEFTKMIVAALRLPLGGSPKVFLDVNDGDWFKEFVDISSSHDIVKGISDTQFSPNTNITRQDLATIAYRAMVYLNAPIPQFGGGLFPDDTFISDYAKDGVYVLKELDIVGGRPDGNFDPLAFATREETAKIVCGVMDHVFAVTAAQDAAEPADEAGADANADTDADTGTDTDTNTETGEGDESGA